MNRCAMVCYLIALAHLFALAVGLSVTLTLVVFGVTTLPSPSWIGKVLVGGMWFAIFGFAFEKASDYLQEKDGE